MSYPFEVYASTDTLIDRTLALIVEEFETAVRERDRFTIALSGGNTPKPLYRKLAQQSLPWEKCHVFWGDERFVPADHPDSNERMARETWLDHVDIPAANIHPLVTAYDTPEQAAQTNETTLKDFFKSAEWPVFDFVLLGMGDDGHTASLFPGTAALQVCDRWVTVGMKEDQPRLTLTIPAINHAHCVAFLIAGANKNPVLQTIFNDKKTDTPYPSQFIQPQGKFIWLLDALAGKDLVPG